MSSDIIARSHFLLKCSTFSYLTLYSKFSSGGLPFTEIAYIFISYTMIFILIISLLKK